MKFEVTVRNRHGEKIVKRWEVDNDCQTLREIIDEAWRNEQVEARLNAFKRKYNTRSIKNYWYPDRIPQPPPPPPPPEPLTFEDLTLGAYE